MGKLKNYDQFISEGILPEWTKSPEVNNRENFGKYRDEEQSMARFVPGDRVRSKYTPVFGKVTSLGDGMNTVTVVDDFGHRHDFKPEDLEFK